MSFHHELNGLNPISFLWSRTNTENIAPLLLVAPTENDVLSGRGQTVSNLPGNRQFRALVRVQGQRYPNYIDLNNETKTLIAEEILAYIRQLNPPGRFLKEKKKDRKVRKLKGKCRQWVELRDDEKLKKTKKALGDYFRPDRDDYGPRDLTLHDFTSYTTQRRLPVSVVPKVWSDPLWAPPNSTCTVPEKQLEKLTSSLPNLAPVLPCIPTAWEASECLACDSTVKTSTVSKSSVTIATPKETMYDGESPSIDEALFSELDSSLIRPEGVDYEVQLNFQKALDWLDIDPYGDFNFVLDEESDISREDVVGISSKELDSYLGINQNDESELSGILG